MRFPAGPCMDVYTLFKEVYEKLYDKYGIKKIQFEEPVCVVIAVDSDYHRTRRGYMGYEEVSLIGSEEKKWIVGVGIKCGSYPGSRYLCDIIALEYEEDVKDKLLKSVF